MTRKPNPTNAAYDRPSIDVQSVSHSFKEHRALSSVTFSVSHESIHGFVGSNGAGKTTTLKLIATLEHLQQGDISVCGRSVRRNKPRVRESIGFMPDHFSMYRTMRVEEYLDFFAAAYGLQLPKRQEILQAVLDLTDMTGRRNDRIKGLSRGMQQRLSLARVLINDPTVLLLDEPASGLDPRARIELMGILKELRSMGKTIFISSHILSELADLCDAVTLIDRGNIRFSGTMKDLLAHGGEHAVFRVRLNGTDAEHAASWEQKLRACNGIEEIEHLESGDALVHTDRDKIDAQQLLAQLVRSEAPVIGFQEELRHLNEVFLDLTEPGVRE